jgi:acetyl-CoA carboxylase carboxyl transferase subunit alpha
MRAAPEVLVELVLDFERPLIELNSRIDGLRKVQAEQGIDLGASIAELERQSGRLQRQIFASLTPWQRALLSRHPARPYFEDYVAGWLSEWTELHGDRAGHDDLAIAGGLGLFRGRRVMMIGHQKGRNTKENVSRNFGMARPDGYRKALRLMMLAERSRMPIVTLIDTPGAYPGIDAEARGQAEAIARNILEMSTLTVPVVCVVIGEGGSGGALALGVGNRVLMLEHAIYSVISPEGCAAILWHDRAEGPRAAEALKLTASDCLRFGVADELVGEPAGGAHRDPGAAVRSLGDAVARHLDELCVLDGPALRSGRYERFRRLGAFEDTAEAG